MTVGSLRNRPTVPRMPIVATGVLIFMPSSLWATCPATKAKVPSTSENSAPFAVPLGIERILVERHPRVGDKVERGAVGKASRPDELAPVCNHVAFENGTADMERFGDTIVQQR